MRHLKHTFKIGRTTEHREAMLRNMVCSLFQEGRIKTTLTKAKEARRLAEKMITLGKNGNLAARRNAISKLHQTDVVHTLFADIAPRYSTRPGGYTRIIRIGPRIGDAADMCFLELITNDAVAATETPADSTAAAAVAPAVDATTPAVTEQPAAKTE